MRELKFRAKDIKTGEWRYGFVCVERNEINPDEFKHYDEWFIKDSSEYHEAFAIDWKTIGQYTGLKDKNGKEIYEGDILTKKSGDCIWIWVVESNNELGTNLYKVIKYKNFKSMVGLGPHDWGDYYIKDGAIEGVFCEGEEVIGNTHENPELLEKKK